jgi:hypothetical protein
MMDLFAFDQPSCSIKAGPYNGRMMDAPDSDNDRPGNSASRDRRGVQAQRVATGFTVAAILLAGWSLFPSFPAGQLVAVLVAMPLLALILALRFPGRFRIGLGVGYAAANLGTGCAVAAGALLARTLSDINLVSWLPLTAFAIAVAMIFLIVAARFGAGAAAQPRAVEASRPQPPRHLSDHAGALGPVRQADRRPCSASAVRAAAGRRHHLPQAARRRVPHGLVHCRSMPVNRGSARCRLGGQRVARMSEATSGLLCTRLIA